MKTQYVDLSMSLRKLKIVRKALSEFVYYNEYLPNEDIFFEAMRIEKRISEIISRAEERENEIERM